MLRSRDCFMCCCFFTCQMYETRLALQVTVRMEEKRQEKPSEELDSSPLKENSQDTSQHVKPVRSKEQSQIQMSLQTVFALSAVSCWLILRRQLNPQVRRHNPSPLCFQRLSPPCSTRSSPRSSSPALSPAAAEIWPNEPHRTWSSCRQSWETWGTSLTRWRVNTSKALSLLRFWLHLLTNDPIRSWSIGVFAALLWQFSCVPAKKLNCWWMSWMRRKGSAWLYRWRNEGIFTATLLFYLNRYSF